MRCKPARASRIEVSESHVWSESPLGYTGVAVLMISTPDLLLVTPFEDRACGLQCAHSWFTPGASEVRILTISSVTTVFLTEPGCFKAPSDATRHAPFAPCSEWASPEHPIYTSPTAHWFWARTVAGGTVPIYSSGELGLFSSDCQRRRHVVLDLGAACGYWAGLEEAHSSVGDGQIYSPQL